MEIVISWDENLHAFELLKRAMARNEHKLTDRLVGWRGGSKRFDVYWYPAVRLWGVFQEKPPEETNPRRFWNCFGIDDPDSTSMLSITVEINPPYDGADPRVGGMFVRHGTGRYFLGHTGKIGGGRKGIGQQAFRHCHSQGNWQEIERGKTAVLFGPLGDPSFVPELAKYVHVVAAFKKKVASTTGK